jgi:PAS domain S-box-containing protein
LNPSTRLDPDGDGNFQVLWKDEDRVFCRGWRLGADGNRSAVLEVMLAAEHPSPDNLNWLTHEYGLRDDLDDAWAARPLELLCERGQTILVLKDPRGEPLDSLVGPPMEISTFLRLAIAISAALGRVHGRGLVHKDIKPTNILVNSATGQVWLTGFGIASRLPRERQTPDPPEFIAGTLAYMAPEQTGRMNRSIDSRSDLYSLGVTLYQLLTSTLPFTASDPMEWVHCHIARKPNPPSEHLENLPAPVSAIVMKLLAKTAEERYQTAAGVESDLQRCFADWETQHRIEEFSLGEHDTPSRLWIPEKLYGRETEINTLLTAFDRIVAGGRPELVLVSGYSGIGKSSIVNELHKPLVPPRGLFASGKFDQYKRDIPYSTLAQAFQGLIGSFLSKSEPELRTWRNVLREALDPNGLLIADLIPELKLIIGEQPPVPELPPQDAQRRFQLVFRRFIGVFARPEHPLALFLDDLQWLDVATLDVLEDLLTRPDMKHLLLIGAYRDNEVNSTHPLKRKLEAMREAGAVLQDIVVAPLVHEDLRQLIADSLHCELERATPLAQLVHDKTVGNPFFAIEFISALAEEGLLTFDHGEGRWFWNLNCIHAKGYTDNVVDLVVGRLNRLPVATLDALRQLACLGNSADFATLQRVYQGSHEDMNGQLWEAVRAGLIFRSDDSYKFLHDRVQEAAYSLIPEELRAAAHLRIGRLLLAHTPLERREEAIFEIVNQLDRGAASITDQEEREQLVELNLTAAKRAKASTAYASALKYLIAGAGLLGEDCWSRRPELTFTLELQRAECEFLTGLLLTAEERLAALSERAADTMDRAAVTCLQIDLYTTEGQSDRAIAVGLDYLRVLGIDWAAHPTEAEARSEYERLWSSQLGGRGIEELIDLPLMRDPVSLATLNVLTALIPPAYNTDSNLMTLSVCRGVSLGIEHGNSDGACVLYQWFGAIAGARFGDYHAGYRFGRLGCELVERRGLKRFQAKTLMIFGAHVVPQTRHVREGRDPLRRAFETAEQSGDLTFAAYTCANLNSSFLAAGDPLVEAKREAERGLAFAQEMRFGFVMDWIYPQLGLIRTLLGLTRQFGVLDDGQLDECQMECRFTGTQDTAQTKCVYWIRKLQARVLAGEYTAAAEASANAQRLLSSADLEFETAEYHFYGALSLAAAWDSASPEQRQQDFEALTAHHRQLEIWAENCPENFEGRAALVGAEIARVEGRDVEAMRLYERSIHIARVNDFVHVEAVANEVAARFYLLRGFEKIAYAYLREARYCYLRWGADGKVRHLDKLYPHLREERRVAGATSTMEAPVEQLDLATVIRVSQAVSGEIVLEKLLEIIMRTAIAQAGAERGLLILSRETEPHIEAEAATRGDSVVVQLRHQIVSGNELPSSVLNHVLRTRESVILDDAAAEPPFGADPYVRQCQARSILCLPLMGQAKLIGALYLENNLTTRVFATSRIAVLKLLASQAAIALENARLYRDLAEREAKIRRLVDANIIGIFISRRGGDIVEANDAFLKMVGYDRGDLAAGRVRWTDLTAPQWLDSTAGALEEIDKMGATQAYEKEYLRKDGSRVPVLIGTAAFNEARNEAVTFVLDLTERKRAEAAAREVQLELAHANRVATMGQLTASIAHEVKQPIGAAVASAQAALRFLGRRSPELGKVRQTLETIVETGHRAAHVVDRIHALIKKAPTRNERLEINEAILEVIELIRGEAVRNGTSVQTDLAEDLPLIEGDRVQLQQVILNLAINAVEAMSVSSDCARDLLIRTRKLDSGGVFVAIRDSGPGLAPATLDHLFDPFYTTKPGGLGLGLSICHSIIDAHGGRLSAHGNEPRGATFEFTLPAHRDTGS